MCGSAVFSSAGPTRRLLFLVVAAAIGVAVAGGPARAQAPADGHWLPWLGCWAPVPGPDQPDNATKGGLCIHATAGAPGVTFATVAEGKVIGQHPIVADGARHTVTEGGCQGWESAKWSSDGRRLLRRAELDCGGARRLISGVLLMQPESRWTDIEAAGTPGNMSIRVVDYRPMNPASALATQLVPQGQDLAIQINRAAASAPLQVADVIEASRQLDARVVQALVYERGNGYALDGRTLERLADERVSTDVIDLMVALSYPDFFSIDGSGGKLALRADSTPARGGRGGYGGGGPGWGCYAYGFNPWGYGYPYWMAAYRPVYGYGYTYGYGYGDPYGYGYGDPCFGGYGGGYGGYWGGGYWGYPSGGVIVIKNPDQGNGHGRATRGGYTPGSGSGGTGRSAHPRDGASNTRGSGSSGSTAKGSGSSSGSSGSSRGNSGSDGSSTGRTAHPRDETHYTRPSLGAPPPSSGGSASSGGSSSGASSPSVSAPTPTVSRSSSSSPAASPSRGGDSSGGTSTGGTAHPR